jgi:anaerobic selenocysteine-containing dehydrogenase
VQFEVAPGLTFAELARAGTVFASEHTRLQFADLRFATPSGKIEVDGAAFARAGLDPIPRAGGTSRPPPGLLRLLSPSHPLLMNSTYGNDPRIRKRLGEATVVLNPTDAAQRQLHAGDLVDMRSSAGGLRLRVQIADLAPAGVAVCYNSRWPGQDGGGNVNRLNPALRADLGDGTAVNSVEVTITADAAPAAIATA